MGKWKVISAVALTLVILVNLAGCGASQSSNQSQVSGAQGNGSKGVTLTWFMWSDSPAEMDSWKELASDVTKKYPNIHIKLETTSWPDYWNKLQTEIASGTTPDIISLQSLRVKGFGSGFLPLDDFIKKDPNLNVNDFDKNIYNSLQYNGHQIALPYDFGPRVIYYNRDLFDKYHVPYPKPGWTWNDFLNDVKLLSHGNDYGFVTDSGIDDFLPFVLSNGGKYLDENGQYNLNDPKTVEVIQQLANLVKNHEAPQMVATNDPNWAMEQWMAGNIGMHVNGPWEIVNFKKNVKFNFGIAPIPVGSAGSVTVGAGSGFGISKTCEHPEEAFKAISVLTDSEELTKLATWGRALPARDSARPVYYKNVPGNFQPNLQYALDHSVPEVITNTWQQADDTIFQSMVPIYDGQVPVKQGMDQLQQQLSNLQGQ